MKKRTLFLSTLLITSSLFLAPNVASADPCSPSDPCQTYATVDPSGNVTNVIVCQPSVCGGGTFGGERVVPQVSADPQTGENRGSVYQPGRTRYDGGVFTFQENVPVQNSIIDYDENGNQVVSSATVNGRASSFTYADSLGVANWARDWSTITTPAAPFDDTSATISVQSNNSVESISFDNRKTENEIRESAINSRLVLINQKIDTLVSLLGSWVK
jgi:hypothetical protein